VNADALIVPNSATILPTPEEKAVVERPMLQVMAQRRKVCENEEGQRSVSLYVTKEGTQTHDEPFAGLGPVEGVLGVALLEPDEEDLATVKVLAVLR
jgi:hypothetical protein